MSVTIERVSEKREQRITQIERGTVFEASYVGIEGLWIKTDEGSIVLLKSGLEFPSRTAPPFTDDTVSNYREHDVRIVVEE